MSPLPVAVVPVHDGREPEPEPISSPPVREAPAQTPLATPTDLARLAAASNKDSPTQARPAEAGRGWEVRSAEHDEDLPRLKDLTSGRQTWLDNEQDATETTSNPFDVGARFGGRWASRASAEQRAELLKLCPQAPRRLDGELLKYAERAGIDTWEDEAAKFAVRDGFWHAIAAAEPDGHARTGSVQ